MLGIRDEIQILDKEDKEESKDLKKQQKVQIDQNKRLYDLWKNTALEENKRRDRVQVE